MTTAQPAYVFPLFNVYPERKKEKYHLVLIIQPMTMRMMEVRHRHIQPMQGMKQVRHIRHQEHMMLMEHLQLIRQVK